MNRSATNIGMRAKVPHGVLLAMAILVLSGCSQPPSPTLDGSFSTDGPPLVEAASPVGTLIAQVSSAACPAGDVPLPERIPIAPLSLRVSPPNSSIPVVLDLAGQGSNLNRASLSLRHAFDAFGIPYQVTSDVDVAMGAPEMLLIAGSLGALPSTTATSIEARLKAWLSAATDRTLWLFADNRNTLTTSVGVHPVSRNTARSHIAIDPTQPIAAYLDTPEEQDLYVPSYGDGTLFVPTVGYETSQTAAPWQADVVGTFDDGTSAIVVARNTDMNSRLVAVGFSIEDFLFRMEYQKSALHIRGDVNTFEPCADTVRLMLRAGYEGYTKHPSLRPFTANGRKAPVILTHDVDATVSYPILRNQFMPLENSLGLRSTLFVTTCYRSNGWIADMFSPGEHQGILRAAFAGKWDLQSHSVSHMPDADTWPEGDHATNPTLYTPHWDSVTKKTTGGALWPELVISAGELAECEGVSVLAWRTGYLAASPTLGDLLEKTGYYLTSDVTAGTVGGSFPYPMIRDRKTQDNGAETAVLQVPFALSDHLIATQDPEVVARNWLDITRKNANNNAPTVILVHPSTLDYVPAYTAYVNAIAQDPELWVTTFDTWYRWYRDVGIRSEVAGGH